MGLTLGFLTGVGGTAGTATHLRIDAIRLGPAYPLESGSYLESLHSAFPLSLFYFGFRTTDTVMSASICGLEY